MCVCLNEFVSGENLSRDSCVKVCVPVCVSKCLWSVDCITSLCSSWVRAHTLARANQDHPTTIDKHTNPNMCQSPRMTLSPSCGRGDHSFSIWTQLTTRLLFRAATKLTLWLPSVSSLKTQCHRSKRTNVGLSPLLPDQVCFPGRRVLGELERREAKCPNGGKERDKLNIDEIVPNRRHFRRILLYVNNLTHYGFRFDVFISSWYWTYWILVCLSLPVPDITSCVCFFSVFTCDFIHLLHVRAHARECVCVCEYVRACVWTWIGVICFVSVHDLL